ncbi:hypothetical protein IIC65_00565 [Candidatus Sumerlaeota bacterium]|nr:hypothetical protein [Candidatus Sumerlaeota bacterium]
MSTKISDLSVEEMKKLIAECVRETMEDVMEDILALNNPEFIQSIQEAREDYRKGDVKPLEQVLGD